MLLWAPAVVDFRLVGFFMRRVWLVSRVFSVTAFARVMHRFGQPSRSLS